MFRKQSGLSPPSPPPSSAKRQKDCSRERFYALFHESKKIICPAHAAHVGHMIGITPSTACELLPPPAGGPPPSKREVWGFAGQGLRPCRRLHIGALRSPLSPFARPLETLLFEPFKLTGAANIKNGRAMRAPTVYCGVTDGCKCISQLQFPSPKTSLIEGGGPPQRWKE